MKRISIAACALVIAASYLVAFLPQPAALKLLREDGPIEQAGAMFFLLSCVSFLQAWRTYGAGSATRDPREGHRIFYLILAVLMFLCAGEEISWGQRIFGWRTPAGWSEANAQSETNIHNLAFLEGGVREEKTRTFLHLLTNANRLFAMFWLACFVILPTVDRASSRMRGHIRTIGLPVPPFWIGAVFILNHTFFYLAARHLHAVGPYSHEAFPLEELKEHNCALIYASAGLAAWLRVRSHLRSEILVEKRA